MRKKFILAFALAVLLTSPAWAAKGVALITATQPDSQVNGEANFNETVDGLEVEVNVANVPPGKHGFHIHEKGDCTDKGNAAGGHYNPANVTHGLVSKDGFEHAHTGDFGNIEDHSKNDETEKGLERASPLKKADEIIDEDPGKEDLEDRTPHREE